MEPVDIVIPVYNESVEMVRDTVSALREALAGREGITIIVVDDGSAPEFGLDQSEGEGDVVGAAQHGYGGILVEGRRVGGSHGGIDFSPIEDELTWLVLLGSLRLPPSPEIMTEMHAK